MIRGAKEVEKYVPKPESARRGYNHSDKEIYAPVSIKLRSQDSMFLAEFMQQEFSDSDINKLKKVLDDEATANESTSWEPVIVVDLDDENSAYYGRSSFAGFSMDTKLLGTTTYPSGETKKVLAHISTQEFSADRLDCGLWIPIFPRDDYEEKPGKKLLKYSREKYETLSYIKEKMFEFRKLLIELLNSDKAEAFIQHVGEHKQSFLPPPKEDEKNGRDLVSE